MEALVELIRQYVMEHQKEYEEWKKRKEAHEHES